MVVVTRDLEKEWKRMYDPKNYVFIAIPKEFARCEECCVKVIQVMSHKHAEKGD